MKIVAVCTPGQGGRRYALGQGVERFEEFKVSGQMASLPWIRVFMTDGVVRELNVAELEYIDRLPDDPA